MFLLVSLRGCRLSILPGNRSGSSRWRPTGDELADLRLKKAREREDRGQAPTASFPLAIHREAGIGVWSRQMMDIGRDPWCET